MHTPNHIALVDNVLQSPSLVLSRPRVLPLKAWLVLLLAPLVACLGILVCSAVTCEFARSCLCYASRQRALSVGVDAESLASGGL